MNNQLISFHRPESIVTPKRGASGTLRHVTPTVVRQPSLIERMSSKVSTGKLFSFVAVLAVASWIWG